MSVSTQMRSTPLPVHVRKCSVSRCNDLIIIIYIFTHFYLKGQLFSFIPHTKVKTKHHAHIMRKEYAYMYRICVTIINRKFPFQILMHKKIQKYSHVALTAPILKQNSVLCLCSLHLAREES